MNKISKIIISSLCISSIMIVPTYAKELTSDVNNVVQKTSAKSLKTIESQTIAITDLHQDKNLNQVKKNMQGHKLSTKAKLENQRVLSKIAPATTSSSVSQTITGKITEEGGYTYTTASLDTNQILQATLKCPNNKNLDYDLYLYELKDDGTLGECVDSSTTTTYFNKYPDGTEKTLDEGVSWINKGDSKKYYAVIISSKKGSSTTDEFTLNLSLDVAGSYDSAEPNNNPFKAYTVNHGTISGANLNVSNDEDWYVWNVPVDFNKASITVANNYNVEVYTADGTSMVLKNPDDNNEYTLSKGYYYIKVLNKSTDFTPSNYDLTVNPTKLNAAKIIVDMNGDMGKDFPSYDGTNNYLRFKDVVTPTITVSSENGYAVSNCPVYFTWESESWNEGTGNKTRTSDTVTTGKDGSAIVSLKVPTSLGVESYTVSGPKIFTHHFDIDTVKFTASNTITYTTFVYHFAYSDYIGG